MEPRIEKKDAFCVLGLQQRFDNEHAMAEIPAFWNEFFQTEGAQTIAGEFGISVMDIADDPAFHYVIGDACPPDIAPPEGFTVIHIPSLEWAIFSGEGQIPQALQELMMTVSEQWMTPESPLQLSDAYAVEAYSCGDPESGTMRFELWFPLR